MPPPGHHQAVAGVPISLADDADVTDDGVVRQAYAARGLDGPPGILQGGLSSGLLLAAARAADPFGAPPTSVHARLHAPTPLGAPITTTTRRVEGARYEVETSDGRQTLVSGTVELAGHDLRPRVGDLQSLAAVPLPTPNPQHDYPTCWVCGPDNPDGLHLHPAPHAEDQQVSAWIPDERFATERGTVDPVVMAAVLDCPTVWAAEHHWRAEGYAGALLAGFHIRFFREPAVLAPLRVVALHDRADGRKIEARAAVIDEERVVYAVSSVFHVAVREIPSLA